MQDLKDKADNSAQKAASTITEKLYTPEHRQPEIKPNYKFYRKMMGFRGSDLKRKNNE